MIKCIQFLNIENEFNAIQIMTQFREKFTTKFIDFYRNNCDIYIELETSCFDLFLSQAGNVETFVNIPNLNYEWKFESVKEIKERILNSIKLKNIKTKEYSAKNNENVSLKDIQLDFKQDLSIQGNSVIHEKDKDKDKEKDKMDSTPKSIKLQGIKKENYEQILTRAEKELGKNFLDSYFKNDILFLEINPLALSTLDINQLIQAITEPFSLSYELLSQPIIEIKQRIELESSSIFKLTNSIAYDLSKKSIEDPLNYPSQPNIRGLLQENIDNILSNEEKEGEDKDKDKDKEEEKEEEGSTKKLKNIVHGMTFKEAYPDLIQSVQISEETNNKKNSNPDNWNLYCNSLKSCISESITQYREPCTDLIYNKLFNKTNIYFCIAILWVFLLLELIALF